MQKFETAKCRDNMGLGSYYVNLVRGDKIYEKSDLGRETNKLTPHDGDDERPRKHTLLINQFRAANTS